jgi:hypothetical protein
MRREYLMINTFDERGPEFSGAMECQEATRTTVQKKADEPEFSGVMECQEATRTTVQIKAAEVW